MALKELSFSDAVKFSKMLDKKSFFANPFYLYHNCFFDEKNGEILVYEKSKIDNQHPLLFLPNKPDNFTGQIVSTGFDEDISVIEKTHELRSREILGYEYFYSSTEWIELEGHKFEPNRKQIKRFQKDHAVKILDNYPKAEVLKFLDEWAAEKRKKEVSELTKSLFEAELKETVENLELIENVEHQKIFVEENGKLLGFSVSFPFIGDLWVALIQKSRLDIQGLSRFFYHLIAKGAGENKILATGAEAQDPGLKAFKESLRPVEIKTVYVLKIGNMLQ